MLTKEDYEEERDTLEVEKLRISGLIDSLNDIIAQFVADEPKRRINGTKKSADQRCQEVLTFLGLYPDEQFTGHEIHVATGMPQSSARAAVKQLSKVPAAKREVLVRSRDPLTISAA